MEADVVVAGGGLAGLTCAVGLSRAGLRVVVVEREPVLGGRARSFREPVTGDVLPIGPHIFVSEYPNVLALLDVLGTRDRIVWQEDEFIAMVDGRRRVSMRMSRLPAPFHFVPSLIADPQLRNRDWLSNVPVTLVALAADNATIARLDREEAVPFLRRLGVTERYLDRFWAFVSTAIMNVPLERCSAGALLRVYRRLIGKRGYRIGFPDEGLGDLFAPQCERLIEAGGGRVLRGTAVRAFLGDARRARGVVLEDGHRIEARFSVGALTPHALHGSLPDEWKQAHGGLARLDRHEACPYVSVFLWLDRKLTTERFWARLPRAGALNCDFYDLSNINPGWIARPSIIASNIIFAERAGALSDRDIVERTVAELGEYLPAALEARLLHSHVSRIPMAIPCPYVGAESLRLDGRTPIDGLVLAGDWTRTGLPASMESACLSGWRAADVVLAGLGRPAALARPHVELDPLASLIGRSVSLGGRAYRRPRVRRS